MNLNNKKANPNSIAALEFNKALYGRESILSQNLLGTQASVKAITTADLQNYYTSFLSPSVSTFHILGDINEDVAVKAVEKLNADWTLKKFDLPDLPTLTSPEKPAIYFYNLVGAKQSVFYFGYPAVNAMHPDYYPLQIVNYILGGGGFASRLTQQLREGKGYTYGIGSTFTGGTTSGYFAVRSGVRSNVTYESAALVKDILENYAGTFTDQDLEVTKSYLLKSGAREFETREAKLEALTNISAYNWPYDYARQREQIVKDMTVAKVRELAGKCIMPYKMNYIIVGDAQTQAKKLGQLGLGEPVMVGLE